MLDFYLLSDVETEPKIEELDNLDYAGGLEFDTYNRLVGKGIIDSSFDYYSDFRWGNQLIEQIASKANNFTGDSDVNKLIEIIKKAINREIGLIAFGD